jgi:hypothetical protein
MSRYKSDDGTFWMGLFAAGMAIVGFCAGYTIRDNGYIFGATKTPTPKAVKGDVVSEKDRIKEAPPR